MPTKKLTVDQETFFLHSWINSALNGVPLEAWKEKIQGRRNHSQEIFDIFLSIYPEKALKDIPTDIDEYIMDSCLMLVKERRMGKITDL